MNAVQDPATRHARRPTASVLPANRSLFVGGAWRASGSDRRLDVSSPSTGESLGSVAHATAEDVDLAVREASVAYRQWRRVPPAERAGRLRRIAAIIRENADDLALLDAIDGGMPVHEAMRDVHNTVAQFEFFAGLVTEMKGQSVPMGPDSVNFSVREPRGVVGRIIPFNHPFMFAAAKSAAPLAAGNTVIVKPPEQAPLSALKFAELIKDALPPGCFNVVTGARDTGAALSTHPGIAMVSLIGSVAAGRAVMRAASETLKPVLLELGGKNALIALPDADPDEVASAMVAGMNFTWCGQSCGSTSRAFLHASIHDEVVRLAKVKMAQFAPGDPTDPATTMGAMITAEHMQRSLDFIASAHEQGATLAYGGERPSEPALARGNFLLPTMFTGVTQPMKLASEEAFGPVLAVLEWSDEAAMIADVNRVEYGLTCSIWSNDIRKAHRLAADVEAGYVWINEVSRHLLGTPFGGYKQSGMGREECLEELLAYTQEKHVHVNLKRPAR